MSFLSPARPTVEALGTSASTAASGPLEVSPSGHVQITDDDTVETLQTKLAIERRVQYGAEKMLDVIESRQTIEPEQEQVRERIEETLVAANDRIRQLEERLDKLQGGSSTPSRARRPGNKLHAFSSQTSLSSSSSQMLTGSSHRQNRPMTRQPSTLSSDQAAMFPLPPSVSGTPSRGALISPHRRHRRTASYGASSGAGMAEEATEFPFDRPLSGMISPQEVELEDEGVQEGLVELESGMRRLRALVSGGKGKGKEKSGSHGSEAGRRRREKDEVWEVINGMANVLKREEGVRVLLDPQELVESVFPFMVDAQTSRRRVAGYRLMRLALDRRSWGIMIDGGMEYLLTRTFLRDPKTCSAEREQALRLVRAVLSIPPAPFRAASPYSLSSPVSVGSSQVLPVPMTSRSRRSSQHGHTRPLGDMSSRNGALGRSRRSSFSAQTRRQQSHKSSQRLEALQAILRQKVPLTEGMIRTIVAAAENPDEILRIGCMLTLVELGILDIQTLAAANALRTVLHVFNDGPSMFGTVSTGLLIYLANHPSTRLYLTPGSDVESALVGLTEEYGKVTSPRSMTRRSERLEESGRYVKMLLNSWPGLIYLCADNLRSIRSLVGQLVIPQVEVREATLDLFFDVLRIKAKVWRKAFLEGKRLTVYYQDHDVNADLSSGEPSDNVELPPLNLVDHYISLVLAVLLQAGLLEALTVLVEDTSYVGNRKATLLLAETLQLVNRLLPFEYAAKLQALPTLFRLAMQFRKPRDRVAALAALASVDSVNRHSAQGEKQAVQAISGDGQSALDRGQKQVQQAKLRFGLQVEDKQFQQMIVDTGVLVVREHGKWDYELILDLVEGPLANPKRLEETIRATKFLKRIFSFFHPYNNRFSSLSRTRNNHRWVKLGCTLLELLLSNPEGLKFLAEDKLLRQIADCFVELDHQTGIQLNHHPIFSKERIANTLTYGYFQMLGVLSRHREGLKMIDQQKIFTSIYHLSEQRQREDIVRMMVECFDYGHDSHARTALSKALTTSNYETRLFVTNHLGRLMHEQPSLRTWTLQMMATQLYDISPEVCEAAVLYLEELCHDMDWLRRLVELRPTLEHLGDVGHPLALRFVSTSEGFRYLSETGYIARELEDWLTERNALYVIETETFVTKTLRPLTADTVEDVWQYDSVAPSHFLGELSKTPEGCQLLRERGLVGEYADVVRVHGMEEGDEAFLINVKLALWALGNIGSNPGGMALLEDEEILDYVVEIAEHHPVLTMRGTGFFVLGLLSQTSVGAETLEEYGWTSTRGSSGRPTGLCLPSSLARFTHIEPWSPPLTFRPIVLYPDMTERQEEVMTWIGKLGMPNMAPLMLHNLKRVRLRYHAIFQDVDFFARALRHVSTCHASAPVRKFVLEMFDVPLNLDTLERLRQLEYPTDGVGSLPLPRSTRTSQNRDSSRTRQQVQGHPAGQSSDSEAHRKRASSNPGPGLDVLPPKLRNRGTTVSGLGPGTAGGPPQLSSLAPTLPVPAQAASPLSSVFTAGSLGGPFDELDHNETWHDAEVEDFES